MKKYILLLLTVLAVLSFCIIGCDQEGGDSTSSSSSSSGGGGGSTPPASSDTTLNVTINVSDVTMDDIFVVYFFYGTGNYTEGATPQYNKSFIKDGSDMTITKTDNKLGTIKFTITDSNLSTAFKPYYLVQIYDEDENPLCNLPDGAYKETSRFESGSTHSVTLNVEEWTAHVAVALSGT